MPGRGHDGKSAVEIYQKHGPDFVFWDLAMPEYDGFYALENIRPDPSVKIVVMTAGTWEEMAARLAKLKPVGVLIRSHDIKQDNQDLEKLALIICLIFVMVSPISSDCTSASEERSYDFKEGPITKNGSRRRVNFLMCLPNHHA